MATKSAPVEIGFFKSFPASIYSPRLYASMPKRSFWKGFWFLVAMTFALELLWGAAFSIPYFMYREKINETIENVVHFYPENLVITIQDGKASSNSETPVYVKFTDIIPTEGWNEDFKKGFSDELMKKEDSNLEDFNVFVVDTKTPFSVEQFESYKTLAWLTEDAVYVVSDNQKTEMISLADAKDTVITKDIVDQGMEQAWSGIKGFIPMMLISLALGVLLFMLAFRMIYLLIHSLFLLIVFSIMKVPFDYASAYKMGCYSITLSTLLSVPMLIFLSGVPFAFTIVSLLIVVINLDQAKKQGLIKEKKS